MAVTIERVHTKSELRKFIKFPFQLFKGDPSYVPPIISFEESTLLENKNPAFDYCKAAYWVAKKEGKIVGRIAGIIHGEEIKEKPLARFGWIDFADEKEVFDCLINTVREWALENSLEGIHGPLGFTDLDFEGTLIEGFSNLATQATIYNFPYYQQHFERLGFETACDWIEVRGKVPAEMPKKLARSASLVTSRFKLYPKHFKKSKDILKYADSIFQVLNEAYSDLYGYYPLSKRQIKYYTDMYFGFVRKEYVSVVVNEDDQVVGFALSLPSFSKAFKKSKGSLFPFGFIHVLKALRSNKNLDLFLIGVKPEYQKMGANVLIFHQLFEAYLKNGVKEIATGPMLADNFRVLNLWNEYTPYGSDPIRRRCYIKYFE